MSVVATAIRAFEGAALPDFVRRAAVSTLVSGARRNLQRPDAEADARFAREMAERPVAEHTQAANDQHYELPPAFFEKVLGPRLKYSCCLYPTGRETLAEAEVLALAQTVAHADLRDGQHILELGCGWGSLSLWMAETLPHAHIVSVSNSAPQRAFIEAKARAQGLNNLEVRTADMNDFSAGEASFDRVVSIEMFEHMANWRALLGRARTWLKPDGRMFIHVFSHKSQPYRFDATDPADWIAQHFFTGGVMPSHRLIHQFRDLFTVEQDWVWSGANYAHTAEHWLEAYDRNAEAIAPVLAQVYGRDAKLWGRRWRLFFLATAGLFGHGDGSEWAVSHYRLAPVR